MMVYWTYLVIRIEYHRYVYWSLREHGWGAVKKYSVVWGKAERVTLMEERRRNKRTSMESMLMIKRLDGSTHTELKIEVTDISKTGVGFVADQLLQVGEVYEAFLTIWTKEVLHAFLRIVRIELMDSSDYSYGAIFIGMPEMDASRIEVYQTVNDNENE